MTDMEMFQRLFRYDTWANRLALESLESVDSKDDRPRRLFAHILEAQRIWLGRLEQELPALTQPWPARALDECRAIHEELHKRWGRILDGLNPQRLAEKCVYRTTAGKPFETPIEDMLLHVVMHSVYHRGQVAAAVRQAGGKPAPTDYVVYVRQLPG